jgi:hypothetical protein
MKILLLLLSVSCGTNCFAQNIDIYKRKPWEDAKNKMLQHKLLYNDHLKENKFTISDTIIDRSVLRIELKRKYVESNGKGADVYATMPYNMLCIMPDSTFHSNMPVMKSERLTARE